MYLEPGLDDIERAHEGRRHHTSGGSGNGVAEEAAGGRGAVMVVVVVVLRRRGHGRRRRRRRGRDVPRHLAPAVLPSPIRASAARRGGQGARLPSQRFLARENHGRGGTQDVSVGARSQHRRRGGPADGRLGLGFGI